ncbi:MAG: ATP-dependent helicase RecG [Actinomycetota bacterium]|jgi:ATP-dependent DNA helicase RecG|nr:ATP-dependent helicase RecG [Actinomycetota bacterium]
MAGLETPLKDIVGKSAKVLADSLELDTVGDLLRHYPRRYVQRGELTDLRDLQVGEYATVFAEVTKVSARPIRPKLRKADVTVSDGTRSMTLTFFNQPWQEKQLRVGRKAFFAGKVDDFRGKR